MGLLLKELRELRFRSLVLSVLILATGYLVLAYYDLFRNIMDLAQIEEGLNTVPFLAKYLDKNQLQHQLTQIFNDINLYVWSQWFGKNLYQLILLSTIIIGFPLFARETEHDTNIFLLSHQTRARVFFTKLMASAMALLTLTGIGCLLPVFMASYYGFDFSLQKGLAFWICILVSAWLLHAIVVFLSVVSRDTVIPIIVSVTIFVVLGIPGRVTGLEPINIYRYLAGADVFFSGSIPWLPMLVIMFISMVITYFSWYCYNNRDF
ncbi:MAG: ABC transporter permease subunit [Syntrophomonadaceae bacterium]